jgi:hypothetical protein
MRARGKDLREGDIIEVWWKPGREQIIELLPYTGPFDFICCIAKFGVSPVGMSIESENYYEVVNRKDTQG